MLYDIQDEPESALAPETIIELSKIPQVIALKDAKSDYQSTTTVLANTDLHVYSGDDGLTLPLMAAGAVGVVSVTAHVAAAKYRTLVNAMHAGDLATARTTHFELDAIQRGIMGHIQGAPWPQNMDFTGRVSCRTPSSDCRLWHRRTQSSMLSTRGPT